MDVNGVIGYKGKLPWHIPEDLKQFKRLTTDNVIVMGSTTYNSLPIKGLPNRLNIVVTSTPSKYYDRVSDDLFFMPTLEAALDLAKTPGREVFIIGGASIYQQTFNIVDRVYLSLIKGCFDGDTKFPDVDWYDWKKVTDEEHPEFLFRVMDRVR